MKKTIRETKNQVGERIVQITTPDERWYAKTVNNGEGIPEVKFVPSVTWITEFYPKGIGFWKWLANNGWDEAESIKQAAGNKGSKVHLAVEDLLRGEEVKMDSEYLNKDTGREEPLSVEEYECLMSFANWHTLVKPETIKTEITVFDEKDDYAGTIDYICIVRNDVVAGRTSIKAGTYIIDLKTGQNVWPSHTLQVSAYKHAWVSELPKEQKEYGEDVRLAILQLGYRRNKAGWKFTEVEDQFDLFLHAKAIWANECAGIKPSQKDYPLSLKLKVAKIKKSNKTK